MTNDLTSTKMLDRFVNITNFSVDVDDSSKVALVYDDTRLVVYDTLQKEVLKKFRPAQNLKILDVALSSTELSLLVSPRE